MQSQPQGGPEGHGREAGPSRGMAPRGGPQSMPQAGAHHNMGHGEASHSMPGFGWAAGQTHPPTVKQMEGEKDLKQDYDPGVL